MNDIVGIDLGTTNSAIGSMEAGFPILIADAQGKRLTPSVVFHPPDGAEPIVGEPAARMRPLQPERAIYSVKRLMGLRSGDALPQLAYPVTFTAGGQPVILLDGTPHTPEAISALILAKLKRDAEAALERRVTRAVITVPAYFNDAQRAATKRAGELAGLQVERILNEPTAAALAYGLDKLGERSNIAVYDFGGGTFDISILTLRDGVFEVLATNGHTQLGGDDIDQALLAHCAFDLPAGQKRELLLAAKHRLSSEESVEIPLPFTENGPQTYTLSRAELETLARPIVERTRAHCVRSLADAGLAAADLDEVILVGGATRMPLIRRLVEEWFGRPPNLSQHPDEAVAIGATIQAGILSGAISHVTLLDVTPLSLGLETAGGLMNVLIPRNSTIPTKRGEMFTTSAASQTAMNIKILQGEREMARDNWRLGEFQIAFAPAPRGVARVGVQFEIDANGILHVLTRDLATGREHLLEVQSAVDVADAEVEKMIAESVDHAFEDMSERILTEARMKAAELLPAVRSALASIGDQLDAGETARIENLVAEVASAAASGELARLKNATAALDEATQGLATLLMEKALEDALRRRGVL